MGSPTITTLSPRAMAPTASLVDICDASSNTTRSNFGKAGSIYCATEMGDISIQGHIRRSRVGMLSNSLRIGIFLPPLLIALRSMESSELPFEALEESGILAESFATSSAIVSSLNFSSAWAYFFMVSSSFTPWKEARAGDVFIALTIRLCAKAHSKAGRIVSSFTSPFS